MMGTLETAVVLLLLAGSAAFASVALRLALAGTRMHRRALAVSASSERTLPAVRARDPLLGSARASATDAFLFRSIPGANRIAAMLERAGVAMTLTRFGTLVAAGASALCAALLVAGAAPLLAMAGAVLLSIVAARLVLSAKLGRRRRAFQRLLPDAIGLMVRGLRAGVPVSETVAEVGQAMIDPLGGAFRRAHHQVRLGQALESALHAETAAFDSAAMNFLIVTLSVQRETGGNLAETLDKLDDIMRRRSQMQLKIKAMSSEAKASAIIIGSLPVGMGIVMLIVSPDYIMPLLTTAPGFVLLGGAGLSLAIGGWLMAQLVTFEI